MRRLISVLVIFIFAFSFMMVEAKAQNSEAEKIKAEIRRHKHAIEELRARLHSILGSPPKETGYSEPEDYSEGHYPEDGTAESAASAGEGAYYQGPPPEGVPPERLPPKERMRRKWDKPPKPESEAEHRPLPGRRVGPDQEGPGRRVGPPDMLRGPKEEMKRAKPSGGGRKGDSSGGVRSR